MIDGVDFEIISRLKEWLRNRSKQKTKQTPWPFSPRANYTDWATATCRRNLMPTQEYVEKTCPGSALSTTDPTWLDPVPNPATNCLSLLCTNFSFFYNNCSSFCNNFSFFYNIFSSFCADFSFFYNNCSSFCVTISSFYNIFSSFCTDFSFF
jgi:hypothetical protein